MHIAKFATARAHAFYDLENFQVDKTENANFVMALIFCLHFTASLKPDIFPS